jgi:hypothetical protein
MTISKRATATAAAVAFGLAGAFTSSPALAAVCKPIAGLTNLGIDFPMSAQEWDVGLYDGPIGDYSGGFDGYATHDDYLLHLCVTNFAAWGGAAANCVYNVQFLSYLPVDYQEGDPFGWNVWQGSCGHMLNLPPPCTPGVPCQ